MIFFREKNISAAQIEQSTCRRKIPEWSSTVIVQSLK